MDPHVVEVRIDVAPGANEAARPSADAVDDGSSTEAAIIDDIWRASAEAVRRMPRRRLPGVADGGKEDDPAVLGDASLQSSEGPHPLRGMLLSYYGGCRVAWLHLLSWESLFVSVLSVLNVLLFTFAPAKSEIPGHTPDAPVPLATNLSLFFISLVIVFPITASIQLAFGRRERALDALAGFRANLVALMLAHRDWDWPPHGVQKDGHERHLAEVRACLVLLCRAMRDYLALPLVGRSRHLFTVSGAKERMRIHPLKEMYGAHLTLGWSRLSVAVEALKARGLPASEASRMNQYMLFANMFSERLRNAKNYRTPQALRAFARLYIAAHCFFTGPYYAWIALTSSLAFALCLSIFTAVSMVGLLRVAISLEDPFDQRDGLDDVHVSRTFSDIERHLMVAAAGRDAYVRGEVGLLGVLLDDATDGVSLPEDLPFSRTRFGGTGLGGVAAALAELSNVHQSAARRFEAV